MLELQHPAPTAFEIAGLVAVMGNRYQIRALIQMAFSTSDL
jgi:hypothetical protein